MKVSALFLFSTVLTAATIPAGTELHVRLLTPVSSKTATDHQAVRAVLIMPVMSGTGILLPAGTKVSGEVAAVKPATAQGERAQIRLVFNKAISADGKPAKLNAQVTSVDNARESVDEKGTITGITTSETLSARMDTGIGKLSQRYPGFGELLGNIKSSMVSEASGDIEYGEGVEMTLKLLKPLTLHTAAGPEPKPITPKADLVEMVNAQPFRTLAQNPPNPSDITNLMFLGTERDIEDAFRAAGWTTADPLTGRAKMETVRAVVEMRGYKEAPASLLTLEGRPPDLVFQKQNDTFAKRHHLRIWRRPGTFNDLPIWVCAATHDTGIDFSAENRTFIHKIDPEIDQERAKIVADLLFTGMPTAISVVDRPAVPKHARNGTGDEIVTDGRMAVVEF